ncbi:MAG: response regulator [Bacteroidota bacterium]
MPGFSILVIDDDQIYRYMANKMLLATGLTDEIIFCKNGAEGWKVIKDKLVSKEILPDIIFLDINMPVMNGWEFLKKISPVLKNADQKIQIYIVTSSQDENDLEHSGKFDCISGYLVKPVMNQTFSEILSSVK